MQRFSLWSALYKKCTKGNTKELILSPTTVKKYMCESLSTSETRLVLAGWGSFLFFPISKHLPLLKSTAAELWVGGGFLSPAGRFYFSRNWCCCTSAKIPVFSNSKALQASHDRQMYSSKDDLQKRMKAVLEKELAVCMRTISTVHSCDRWEPPPFCQVNSRSSVYFPSNSGASYLTQALSMGKSYA